MVRKIISDLISGVRDGVAWGLCFVAWPPRRHVWFEFEFPDMRIGYGLASSPPRFDRAEKKRADLAARNRYGRFLDLTIEETDRWTTDDALRAECNAAAQCIANAFRAPITIIASDGCELAIVEPSCSSAPGPWLATRRCTVTE